MKLRTRFALGAVALVLLVLGGGLGSLYLFERRYLTERAVEDCRQAQRRLVRVAEEALAESKDVVWLNYAKIWLESPGAAEAAVVDLQGKVYLHSDLALGEGSQTGRPHSDAFFVQESLESETPLLQVTGDVLKVAAPVRRHRKRFGSLVAYYDDSVLRGRRDAALRAMAWRLSAVGLAGLALGLAGAFWLSRNVTRPIEGLVSGARKLGQGEFGHEVSIHGADELGFLAGEFNEMARRLKELDELKARFLQTVSHDMRSPLSVLANSLARARKLARKAPMDGLEEDLTAMERGLIQLTQFVNDILDLARLQEGRGLALKPVEVPALLDSAKGFFAREAQGYGIALEAEAQGVARRVRADAEKLQRVLSNLLLNAFRFTPSGGRIRIQAREEGEGVRISVSDTGEGIPEAELGRIFSRFHQVSGAKPAREMPSSGLGLSICKEIVEAHGGRIWVESSLNRGSTFHLLIPYA